MHEDTGFIAAFILTAVTIAMIGQGFVSLLEHQRRKMAMEVIRAAIEAGKEPPQQLYDQLSKADKPKAPWSEVILFSALAFGFWIAFANADGNTRIAFMVIAATMTVTALGCLGLAIMRPGRGNDDK